MGNWVVPLPPLEEDGHIACTGLQGVVEELVRVLLGLLDPLELGAGALFDLK